MGRNGLSGEVCIQYVMLLYRIDLQWAAPKSFSVAWFARSLRALAVRPSKNTAQCTGWRHQGFPDVLVSVRITNKFRMPVLAAVVKRHRSERAIYYAW